ncbi:MAG: glutaredoxin 3 [Alphaproteobacteria bacterium]
MAKVEIYTTRICPYCHMAKRLLQKKGIAYEEIDVGRDPALRQHMTERSGGGRTVPQIFIDDQPIGGCDDLHALEAAGKLDQMLGVAA